MHFMLQEGLKVTLRDKGFKKHFIHLNDNVSTKNCFLSLSLINFHKKADSQLVTIKRADIHYIHAVTSTNTTYENANVFQPGPILPTHLTRGIKQYV